MALRLLVEATIGGTLYRLSDEDIYDLTNRWYGYIQSCSGINYRLTARYGGFAKYNVGNIVIRQNLWGTGTVGATPSWPPAQLIDLDIYYTFSTEAAKINVVHAQGYRTEVDGQNVSYAVYPVDNADTYVLDEVYTRENVTSVEVNDGLDASPYWQWTASGSGTNEYYLEDIGGGSVTLPLGEPDRYAGFGSFYTRGTAGSLGTSEWDWADNDALGFSTIYTRLASGADPDTLAKGQIRLDYGTVATAVPRAFGEVINKELIRLPDVMATNQTTRYFVYDAAHIYGTKAKAISAIASGGGGLTTITATAHGFSNGDTVFVEIVRGDYYNGEYIISNVAANTFDIPRTYTAPTVSVGHCYKAGYYRLYDDGVPYVSTLGIAENKFYCNPSPSGKLTVSGTGYNTASVPTQKLDSLTQIGTYFISTALTLSLNSSGARSPATPVKRWETRQMPILDWWGELCAYATHATWIAASTSVLWLREVLFTAGGGGALDEFDILEDVRYRDENKPLANIVTTQNFSDWDEDPHDKVVPYLVSNYSFAENVNVTPFSWDKDEILAELVRIAGVLQRRNVWLTGGSNYLPFAPVPGSYISFTDNYNVGTDAITGHVVGVEFDFDRDVLTVIQKQTSTAT